MEVEKNRINGMKETEKRSMYISCFVVVGKTNKRKKKYAICKKNILALVIEKVSHPNSFANKAYIETVPKPCVPNERYVGTSSLIV